ncbi:MAG: ABC transporter ATP-binding protein [Rhodospirillaceae bacterium]|nr:ABC transporter ATP-binding protein [Rhodospirillaceae bacterium]
MNLALPVGSCMSLMGRNGMGKTTTLKTIMGLVEPRSGTVSIKGVLANGMAPNAVASSGIAYVPEGREIFPNLTVRENLLIAARSGPDGRNDWILTRVLELFPRLAERLGHWGNHLSGGEQQMLTIGRALMTNPDVLLLDEVTEGLAPLIRDEIWSVIEVIKGEGMATIIVDKNVGKLMALADQHLIVVKGEVVFSGDSAALAAQPEILHQHLGV